MMRFSEAIRLGGMMSPKCIGKMWVRRDESVCSLGAALRAVGGLNEDEEYIFMDYSNLHKICEYWPYLTHSILYEDFPSDTASLGVLFDMVWRLNDDTDMTREEIANWVEKMEDKYGLVQDQPKEVATEVEELETLNA